MTDETVSNSGFLQDQKGDNSSIRLVFVSWGLVPLFVWATVCLVKMTIVDIPLGVGTIIGSVVAGKVWQAYAEKKKDDSTSVQ